MPPRKLRPLSAEETRELSRWKVSPDRTVWQRARIIELADRDLPAAEIAPLVDLSVESVRRWIRRFNARGLKGLRPRAASGRRPRIAPETRRRIVGLLGGSPRAYGCDQDYWTLRALARVARQLGLVDSISHEEIRRTLEQAGVRLKAQK